jgi:ubiquinone/menaquinone biosynthesis C-methylase UbiE
MAYETIENVKNHYSFRKNAEYRIRLATEGFTGRLITHNFRKIVNLLSPYRVGEKVVDVGCGWGYLASFLPPYVEVCAFDLSREMLEISRDFRKVSDRIIGEAHSVGLKDASFDKLFCIGLTGHIPKLENALREMYRILKPNGLGVINFTGKFGLTNFPVTFLKLKAGYYFKHNTVAPMDDSFTYGEAKRLLNSAGFRVLRSYGWGFSVPYYLGQRIPRFSNRLTEVVIRVQDNFVLKRISNAHIFMFRKI